jgi:thioredoxin 2
MVRVMPGDGAGLRAAPMLEPEARLAKVNIDAALDIAMRFVLPSIPAVFLLRRGRALIRAFGLMLVPKLVTWTRQHVNVMAD